MTCSIICVYNRKNVHTDSDAIVQPLIIKSQLVLTCLAYNRTAFIIRAFELDELLLQIFQLFKRNTRQNAMSSYPSSERYYTSLGSRRMRYKEG